MIKSVKVTNYLGESLTMELRAPAKSGVAVLGVEGLNPPKANINISNLANADGGVFNSARATVRNILVYLKPYKSDMEVGRRKIYKYFPIKRNVELTFETDQGLSVKAIGYVESNDVAVFSSNGILQISILCPSSYLESVATQVSVVSGIQANFTFPFMNDSLDEKLIEFGSYKRNRGTNIHYEGDAETGIKIKLSASGTATNVTIYNSATRQIMKIDTDKLQTLTGNPIIAGDVIDISTVIGNKYARLVRGGVITNILNVLERPVDWFKLIKGDNVFAYVAETGDDKISLQIENKTLYEGI